MQFVGIRFEEYFCFWYAFWMGKTYFLITFLFCVGFVVVLVWGFGAFFHTTWLGQAVMGGLFCAISYSFVKHQMFHAATYR